MANINVDFKTQVNTLTLPNNNISGAIGTMGSNNVGSIGKVNITDSRVTGSSPTTPVPMHFLYMPDNNGGAAIFAGTTGAAAGRLYIAHSGNSNVFSIASPIRIWGTQSSNALPTLYLAGGDNLFLMDNTKYKGATQKVRGIFDSWLMQFRQGYVSSACGTCKMGFLNGSPSTTYSNFRTDQISSLSHSAKATSDATWFWINPTATGTYKQMSLRGTTYLMKKSHGTLTFHGVSSANQSIWVNDKLITNTNSSGVAYTDQFGGELLKIEAYAAANNTAYHGFRVRLNNTGLSAAQQEIPSCCDFQITGNDFNSITLNTNLYNGVNLTSNPEALYMDNSKGIGLFYWMACPEDLDISDFTATTAFYEYEWYETNLQGIENGAVYSGEFMPQAISTFNLPYKIVDRLRRGHAYIRGEEDQALVHIEIPADGPPILPQHLCYQFFRLN